MKAALRLGAAILCGLIVLSAGEIVYWYRLEKRATSYAARIPGVKWTRSVDRLYGTWAPPLVGHDGTLYVATANAIHALDPSNAEKWIYRVDANDSILFGTLAEDEVGNLYFAGVTSLYSFTPSGVKRWHANCPGGAIAQNGGGGPFDAKSVYAICETHFAAIDKSDGRETWRLPQFQTQSPSSTYSPPLILKNGTIIFSRDQHTFATDRDGNILWSYPDNLNAGFFLGAGLDETTYVAKGFAGELDALDADGRVKWTLNGGSGVGFNTQPVTATDGTVYFTGARGPVFAIAPDGTLKWQFRLPPPTATEGYTTAVVGGDGVVYQLLEDQVIALSPEGRMLWQLQLRSDGHHRGFLASAGEGTLYALMDDSMLYAIQTKK